MKARTRVVLLEPALAHDGYSTEPVPDWTQDPTTHNVAAAVEPASTDEDTVTSGATVSRYVCRVAGDTAVDATWRVRWNGHDHDIVGDPAPWQSGRGTRYVELTMKRVTR